MKIPAVDKRKEFYQEIVGQCLASRNKRFSQYQVLRNYRLFGTSDTRGAPFNKIASTCETLCSFIYDPASIRFGLHLGTTATDDDLAKVPKLNDELNDAWRASDSHMAFGLGVNWGLTFGSMIGKVLWRHGTAGIHLIEPHQFGVLREDMTSTQDQEAVVHGYTTTRSQLRNELKDTGKEHIAEQAGVSTAGNLSFSPGMQRLLLAQGIGSPSSGGRGVGGAVAGGIAGAGGIEYSYLPEISAELIDMLELWVWDDDLEDYRIVTIAQPDLVIYDRKNPTIPKMKPFFRIAPEATLYDYYWGESFVAKLTELQDWRTKRILEVQSLLAKQADPPAYGTMLGGIQEEKRRAMRQSGGFVDFNNPSAKITEMKPDLPPDMFKEIAQIDEMFDEQAGIGHILQGKGEAGVRSRGQADLMARLGSARPKSRAIVIEEAAEEAAYLMLRTIQENSKQRFSSEQKTPEGDRLTFISKQFTVDYEVKVDAHSSSPVFVEDRKNDAVTLLEAKAITRERFLDMMDPPNKQLLKAELKTIEKQEQEQQMREQQAQEQQGAQRPPLQAVKGR